MHTELDVLQHLAMEGIAETDAVVSATDHTADDVRETLEALAAEDYIEEDGFWYLTDAGETRLGELCRGRFDEAELAALADLLDSFETLDHRMKELAEAWQELDDSERGPTAGPVGDLAELQQRVETLFDELDADTRAVYEPYLNRLAAAIERLQNGEADYFTATDVDSYHTVWFELHDDLLRTLDRERTD